MRSLLVRLPVQQDGWNTAGGACGSFVSWTVTERGRWLSKREIY